MAVTYSINMRFFFDRPEVLRRLKEKEVRDLSRIGAYAMTVVRRSMRPASKRTPISEPGQPPKYHTKLLRDGILFQYDYARNSVIVGPKKLSGKVTSRQSIPKLLNEGGMAMVPERKRVRTFEKGKRKPTITWEPTGGTVQARYRARPYIGPRAATWGTILNKWRQITGRNNL